jgi:hypothetical protein
MLMELQPESLQQNGPDLVPDEAPDKGRLMGALTGSTDVMAVARCCWPAQGLREIGGCFRLRKSGAHPQYTTRWADATVEQFIQVIDSVIRAYNEKRIKVSLDSPSHVEY